MTKYDTESARCFALLQSKIRQRGYSEAKIQERLGLGPRFFARLAKDPRSLDLYPVLQILEIIGVEAAEFFEELYPLPPAEPASKDL